MGFIVLRISLIDNLLNSVEALYFRLISFNNSYCILL